MRTKTDILSPIQIEILKELAVGAVDKDVARKHGFATHSAFYHRHEIFRKLKVSTCLELTHYAIRKGFVPLMEFTEPVADAL